MTSSEMPPAQRVAEYRSRLEGSRQAIRDAADVYAHQALVATEDAEKFFLEMVRLEEARRRELAALRRIRTEIQEYFQQPRSFLNSVSLQSLLTRIDGIAKGGLQ